MRPLFGRSKVTFISLKENSIKIEMLAHPIKRHKLRRQHHLRINSKKKKKNQDAASRPSITRRGTRMSRWRHVTRTGAPWLDSRQSPQRQPLKQLVYCSGHDVWLADEGATNLRLPSWTLLHTFHFDFPCPLIPSRNSKLFRHFVLLFSKNQSIACHHHFKLHGN